VQPFCCTKEIIITYSERVFVALGTRREMRMCRIDICGLYSSTVFFDLSHNRRVFRKKNIKHKMCVLILSTTFLFLRRTEGGIKNVY
jgi:inorganic pyrophosphatase/exopolyphosphatase